jgi:hypothetical protein
LSQPKPVGRLPQQPGRHSAAAVLLGDVKIADVGPSPVPRQPLSLLKGFYLDVADRRVPFNPTDRRTETPAMGGSAGCGRSATSARYTTSVCPAWVNPARW